MLKQTSPKILDAVKNDTSAALPQNLLDIQTMLVYSNKNGDKILDDKITNLIEIVVAAIEEKDPTPNKQYVPWLVRMYSKGGVKYEDLNRHNMIGMHVEAKRRNMLRPEHKDINRFKTYQEFEDVMFSNYDPDEVFGNEEDETEKPQAKKVFENDQVLIVVPENEAAACKYGKNTRWCTAATHSHNYFNHYNRMGPLYILIPKRPQYEGEKYQLHFESGSYMDEDDSEVDIAEILNNRFGEDVKEFFKAASPDLTNHILLMNEEELKPYIELVKDEVQEMVWEYISDWEINDDYYYSYLRDEGFQDEDGEIDWDRVEKEGLTYSEYNPDVDRVNKNIMGIFDDYDDIIRAGSAEGWTEATDMPDIVGHYLKERFGRGRDESYIAGEIGDTLRRRYSINIVDGVPQLRYHAPK